MALGNAIEWKDPERALALYEGSIDLVRAGAAGTGFATGSRSWRCCGTGRGTPAGASSGRGRRSSTAGASRTVRTSPTGS